MLVRERVVFVAVLIEDMRVGQFALQPAGDADVRLGRIKGRLGGCADDGGIEGAQHGDFFGRHFLRHGDNCFVTWARWSMTPAERVETLMDMA